MKIAVVGVTGMVGNVMCEVLKERNFPITEFIPVASQKSVGKNISFNGKSYSVVGMETAIAMCPDVAIFSAGGSTSLEWAPKFAEVGTTVIDNSSAWRMHEDKRLIVPEINADLLTNTDKIIANPNCSTIQMVVALAPLHRKYKIKRLVVSTYQSMTGTGVKAVRQYEIEEKGEIPTSENKAYPHPIYKNCIPHCDVFLENDYTKEEMKLVHETRKILNDPSLKITATAVRVPVQGGHSESINIEFENEYDIEELRGLLASTSGVMVLDNIEKNEYPTPLGAQGKNEVFVGRIRRDESTEKALNLWIVSDNLRKGAATNAVQIAEYLNEKGILKNDMVSVN